MRTAIIIGAHRQGEKYVKFLIELALQYRIKKIIVTRTTESAAKETAERLKDSRVEIEGDRVRDGQDAAALFDRCLPVFIGITAKDEILVHDIHPVYARIAATYGPTLIEKPFGNPHEDRRSLRLIDELQRAAKYPVGLELTYLPIARAIWNDPFFSTLLAQEGKLECHFVSRPLGDTRPLEDILAQLLVHAASLVPEDAPNIVHEAQVEDRKAAVTYTSGKITGTWHLAYGGNYSGFSIGRESFAILRRPDHVDIIRLPDGMDTAEAIAIGNDKLEGTALLTIDHPLRLHIRAVLDGKPLAEFKEMKASQTVLEDAYAASHSGKR